MRRLLRHLWCARDGVALVEFAITFPVLMTLYLGGYAVSDAIAANRKVSTATRELTDITSRFVSLKSADVDTILGASAQVMAPFPASRAKIILSEIQVCTATTARVVWSQATANTTARVVDSMVTLPTGMVAATMIPANPCTVAPYTGAYLVFGEMEYAYQPPVAYGGFTAMTLRDRSYMSPRISNSVPKQ